MKRPRVTNLLLAALAMLVTVVVYSPVLQNGFVNWDDDKNFIENPSYRGLGPDQLRWMFTTFHMGHYQPLAWVSLGLDYTIWGMNPRGYHMTALILHSLAALAFFVLSRRLLLLALGGSWDAEATLGEPRATEISLAAFAASLLFALHPLRVESVAWATERRDVLSALFLLLAVLAYLAARAPRTGGGDAGTVGGGESGAMRAGAGRRSLIPTLALFLLALLSKAIALVLPALLLILDAYPLRRIRLRPAVEIPRAVLLEKIPFAALSFLFGAVALAAQERNEGLASIQTRGIGGRLASAAYGLAYYVRKTLLPAGFSPVHLAPGEPSLVAAPYLASAAAIALLAAAFTWLALRGHAGPLTTLAAYVVLLAPVLGIAQVWRQIVSDRYAYLSCAGWALLAAGAPLLIRPPGGSREAADARGASGPPSPSAHAARLAVWSALALAVALLGGASRREIRHWRDSESLWRHALAADPENNIAHNNLGVALRARGRADEGERHLREALRIDPAHAEAHYNLANALLEKGSLDEARVHLEEAIRLQPGRAGYHVNLGNALGRAGRYEEAVAEYRRALAIDARSPEAHWNLAVALRALGRGAEADEEARIAHELAPATQTQATPMPAPAEARLARASALYAAGDLAGAIAEYDEVLRAQPRLALAHYGRGVCLLRLGRFDEAEAASRAALAARPEYTNARVNLGVALASLGRLDEAEAAYKTALEGEPTHRAARVNLCGLLASTGRFAEAARIAREGVPLARARGDSALASALEEDAALYAAGKAPGG